MSAEIVSAPAAADTVRRFSQFLDSDNGEGEYMVRIRDMMDRVESRLYIDLNDLREFDVETAQRVIREPFDYIPLLERSLRETVLELDPSYMHKLADKDKSHRMASVESDTKLHVGFEGSFGHHLVSPRGLNSAFVTQLVAVEGIVTKCSVVRPKVVRSVHYCPATKAFHQHNYRDATDFNGAPTGSIYPSKDDQGNPLETEFGLSVYKDHQTFTIQEMPERAPLGQMPRSVDVMADNDLVDKVKPGDRIRVVGVYRALAGQTKGSTSGVFRTVVLTNNIVQLRKQIAATSMTTDDIKNIRQMSKRDNIFNLISRSLAPSIYGHKYIKQALGLLLVGGREKNLPNGTHIRGDINILMVGDPSTAKSQMLRFTLATAPLAINATGRGSSGVGLTAAVTSDPETGDKRLEAGAMVLADRGVVCIDEFDKMSDIDRVTIHEAMEQQTVTIAKAGIQAQLNARCSVVAAANPVYGSYDTTLPPQANVNLPDSLLSRFDLLFIVIDDLNPERDAAIADHVLRTHRYQRPGQEGRPVRLDAGPEDAVEGDEAMDEDDETTPIFQKFNPLLHGGAAAESATITKRRRGRKSSEPKRVEILHPEFIKKYIHYAKARVRPELSDEAREQIVNAYNDIRQKADAVHVSTPVTARALETIIRLSTAHAKFRLSRTVDPKDVKKAMEVLQFALFDAQPEEVKSRAKKHFDGDADESEAELTSSDEDDNNDDDDNTGKKKKSRGLSTKTRQSPHQKSGKRSAGDSADATPNHDTQGQNNTPRQISPTKARRTLRVDSATRNRASGASSAAAENVVINSDEDDNTDKEIEPVEVAQSTISTFAKLLARTFKRTRVEVMTERQARDTICETSDAPEELKQLTDAQFAAVLQALHSSNKIMLTDGMIHSI